jgi:hypothetical protein
LVAEYLNVTCVSSVSPYVFEDMHERLVMEEIVTLFKDTRVIRKVRQTQHQNPEFRHTQGEIFKKTCKKIH